MKKTITILTTTRADYGILRPLIFRLIQDKTFKIRVVATGTHVSPDFGNTYQEIEKDGITIDKKIEILLSADSTTAIAKNMGLAMISFADYFEERCPDALIVLGDRYEVLAICCAAANFAIPIIHLHGGESTEGILDEAYRHCITKLSYLHFASTEVYRKRIIQLGENPEKVFTVGALGVENATHIRLMEKSELEKWLNFSLFFPYAVVTFHPVILEDKSVEKQLEELLTALDTFPDLSLIFTEANADAQGKTINKILQEYVSNRANAALYKSLGMIGYLSAVKYSSLVIGNSSSGIIEVPSFHIPTINIGDRQKGRVKADSIINCGVSKKEIIRSIQKALEPEFLAAVKKTENPYGDGETSYKILEILKKEILEKEINLKKKFFDL